MQNGRLENNMLKKLGKNFRKNLPLTILALPAVLLLFVFNYIPLFGLVLPFKKFRYDKGFWGSEWAGFQNFEYLFTSSDALRATRNTVLYNLVFIFGGMIVAVAIALMLYEMSKRAVKVFQTLLLLPYFISWVVVSYAVRAFLDMDYGLINGFLTALGAEPIMWYNHYECWPYIIIISNIWKGMGYGALVYYAALMGTNEELYEAARIDGAGKLKQIWYISIPTIRPMISMMLILNIGNMLSSDFGLFYNVPLNSTLLYETTDVLSTFTYRALIGMGNVGMSSAASFYQSVVGFFLVLLANWLTKKISEENSLF